MSLRPVGHGPNREHGGFWHTTCPELFDIPYRCTHLTEVKARLKYEVKDLQYLFGIPQKQRQDPNQVSRSLGIFAQVFLATQFFVSDAILVCWRLCFACLDAHVSPHSAHLRHFQSLGLAFGYWVYKRH